MCFKNMLLLYLTIFILNSHQTIFTSMNAQDFIQLNNLVQKLSVATSQTAKADGSFRRYNSQSMEALRSFQNHLNQLEHSLKIANVQNQSLQDLSIIATVEPLQRIAIPT